MKDYWTAQSEKDKDYQEFFKSRQNSILAESVRMDIIRDDTLILDAGCGWGYYVKRFREMGAQCLGCDDNLLMVRKAESLNSEFQIDHMDINNLQYLPKTFDIVVSFGVIEHLEHPEEALKQFHKVLADDGVLWIGVPLSYDYTGRVWKWIRERLGLCIPYPQKHYNEWQLQELLLDNGFKPTKYKGYGYGFGYLPIWPFSILYQSMFNDLQEKSGDGVIYCSHCILVRCEKI